MTVDIPILETDRLVMRAARAEDFEAYAAFYATERSVNRSGPQTREQAWENFAAEIGHWTLRGYGFWGVDDKASGDFCGMVGLYNPEGWPAPEVGWLVWEKYEGKGIAREAAIRARAYAYDVLKWPEISSCIWEGNTRSIALAERLGATLHDRVERPNGRVFLVYRHPSPQALGFKP